MSTPARAALRPVSDIVGDLGHRAESLVRQLLPGGERRGQEWFVPRAASPWGCSASVHLGGARSGKWGAWAAGVSGDTLDLIAAVATGGDKKAAVKWAVEWLGGVVTQPPPHPSPASRGGSKGDDDAERSGTAFRLWLSAGEAWAGTPAERYLLRRGIDVSRLPHRPRALRCHPGLWNQRSGRFWPALLATIVKGGKPVALHRTWLTADGEKAPVFDEDGKSEAKLSLGPVRGGAIPLCRGASGRPLKEALPGSAAWLSEGIEDGLSIALLTGGVERVLAGVSLANLGSLVLPSQISTVVLVGQNDPWWSDPGDRPHGAARGFARAVKHFQDEGRDVRLWRPDGVKDANLLLQRLVEEGRQTCG